MENQPKLNSSKEIISFLAQRFPQCFVAEGEARPLKIGIFRDIVSRITEEDGISKTQLRPPLRMYTSSWRYLYGVKEGAKRVDLDGNDCGDLEAEHVEHARTQLTEAKARVQAQRAQKREQDGEKKPRPADKAAADSRRSRTDKPKAPRTGKAPSPKSADAPRKPRAPRPESQSELTPITDIQALKVGQQLKVTVGSGVMDAQVLEITKDGVRVQLPSGLAMIVRAEHLKF